MQVRSDWSGALRKYAAVAAFFLLSVLVVILASLHEWLAIVRGQSAIRTTEVAAPTYGLVRE